MLEALKKGGQERPHRFWSRLPRPPGPGSAPRQPALSPPVRRKEGEHGKAPDSKDAVRPPLAGLLAALALLFCLLATFSPAAAFLLAANILFFGVSDFYRGGRRRSLSVHVLDVGKADCIYIEAGGAPPSDRCGETARRLRR